MKNSNRKCVSGEAASSQMSNHINSVDKYDKYHRQKRKRSLITLSVVVSVCFICILWKYQKNLAKRSSSSLRSIPSSKNNAPQNVPRSITNYRWVDPRHLPPLPGSPVDNEEYWKSIKSSIRQNMKFNDPFVTKNRAWKHFDWEDYVPGSQRDGPLIDYTKHAYSYPEIFTETPLLDGSYPPMDTFDNIMEIWPQFAIDEPPTTIHETLQHLDFQDPEQMKIATFLRDNELPFKIVNIPELKEAELKWTDEYLSWQFDRRSFTSSSSFTYDEELNLEKYGKMPKPHGKCQEVCAFDFTMLF